MNYFFVCLFLSRRILLRGRLCRFMATATFAANVCMHWWARCADVRIFMCEKWKRFFFLLNACLLHVRDCIFGISRTLTPRNYCRWHVSVGFSSNFFRHILYKFKRFYMQLICVSSPEISLFLVRKRRSKLEFILNRIESNRNTFSSLVLRAHCVKMM